MIRENANKVLKHLYDEYVQGKRFSNLEELEEALSLSFDDTENAIDYLIDKGLIFLSFSEVGHHNSERQEHKFKFKVKAEGIDQIENY